MIAPFTEIQARAHYLLEEEERGVYNMALASTLIDNFDDNVINTTLWTAFAWSGDISVEEANYQLEITLPDNVGGELHAGVLSKSGYSLIGSHYFVEVVGVPPNDNPDHHATMEIGNKIDSDKGYWFFKSGTNLIVQGYGIGSPGVVKTDTYDSTNHKWWRIREASGTIYFDVSADGISWSNYTSDASPFFSLSTTYLRLAGVSLSAYSNPGKVIFNSLNGVPVPVLSEFTTDGIVALRNTEAITADGIIKEEQTQTFTIDGIVEIVVSESFTADGIVLVEEDESVTVDAIVLVEKTKTFTIDGIIEVVKDNAFTIDGIVLIEITDSITIDGVVKAVGTEAFTADAIVLEENTDSFTIDGIIEVVKDKAFTIDGVVLVTEEEQFTTDGIVLEEQTQTVTTDGIVMGAGAIDVTLDSVISNKYYYLGGLIMSRPKSLIRESVFLKTDITAIDGKTSRDTGTEKEKYMLTWEILSKGEMDNLVEIVELNTAVAFSVNDGNLVINEVNVIPFMNTRSYTLVGNNYIGATSLELIVETGEYVS